MKKAIMTIFAASLAMVSCSSDDDGNNSGGNIGSSALTTTITSGSWRITSFTEDGTDHTSDFTGYNFTFNANNTVAATNGTATASGVWTITNDEDDDDDNPSSDVDFNLAFSSPASFSELTEDWDPIERTSTKVRLRHVSGGNGGTDYLTFERNGN